MTAALTFFFTGEIGQASQAADRVFKAYEPEGHRQLVHIYNHDPKCLTLVWAGYWLWVSPFGLMAPGIFAVMAPRWGIEMAGSNGFKNA